MLLAQNVSDIDACCGLELALAVAGIFRIARVLALSLVLRRHVILRDEVVTLSGDSDDVAEVRLLAGADQYIDER